MMAFAESPALTNGTLEAMLLAQEFGIPFRLNTLVSEETAPDLPAVYELLKA